MQTVERVKAKAAALTKENVYRVLYDQRERIRRVFSHTPALISPSSPTSTIGAFFGLGTQSSLVSMWCNPSIRVQVRARRSFFFNAPAFTLVCYQASHHQRLTVYTTCACIPHLFQSRLSHRHIRIVYWYTTSSRLFQRLRASHHQCLTTVYTATCIV